MTKSPSIVTEPWAGGQGVLHRITAAESGKRALVIGGVHGDEICGRIAIERVVREIEAGAIRFLAGSITFIPACNTIAMNAGQRFVEHDLNRELRFREHPQNAEQALGNDLLKAMLGHDVLLDIHSFKAAGAPFIFLGPADNAGEVEPFSQADAELRYAASLGPDTCVFGWLTAYHAFVQRQNELLSRAPAGQETAPRADVSLGRGVVENFRRLGGFGVTIECGNHADPEAPLVAYQAIRSALAFLGIAEGEARPRPFRRCYRIAQVVLREGREDRLERDWKLFDPVQAGDLLGVRADGHEVRADHDGAVIFTYPHSLVGGPWLYVAENSPRGLSL